MIGKILAAPFSIVKSLICLVFKFAALGVAMIFGVIRIIFNHSVGAVLGAAIGLLFGKKHVGLKLFSGKKKKKALKKAKA
jgi:hypothetical protein